MDTGGYGRLLTSRGGERVDYPRQVGWSPREP